MENDRPPETLPDDSESEEDPSSAAPVSFAAVRKTPSLVTEQYEVKPVEKPVVKPIPLQALKEEPYVAPDVHKGDAVVHKIFGTGTITWIDKTGKHIRVNFNAGEKTFIFPDAFKAGFLKLSAVAEL